MRKARLRFLTIYIRVDDIMSEAKGLIIDLRANPGGIFPVRKAITEIPDAGMLVYADSQSQTSDGAVLEDNGVPPDISIALSRDALLQGRDLQLEAAIQYLRGTIK